jgi:GTP-binding protein LepA
MMATAVDVKPIEVGVFAPNMKPISVLNAGDVGYIATGLKTVHEARVGDTVTTAARPAKEHLPGYRVPKPMVFAGIYPAEADDYQNLREALDKLQLNDASLTFIPETSQALGFGFRAGFLGLFHMEIIQERLEREYDLSMVFTAPTVAYEAMLRNETTKIVNSPAELPEEDEIAEIREPWMNIEIITPTEYYGQIMDLVTKRRGIYTSQEYPAPHRVQLNFEIPLSEIIVDFFDELKSRTRGYASLDYQFLNIAQTNYRSLKFWSMETQSTLWRRSFTKKMPIIKASASLPSLKNLFPASYLMSPSRPRQAVGSLAVPMSRPLARMSWLSATVVISPEKRSFLKNKRRVRSA